MNARLIQDEGHRNPMTVPQLAGRMAEWLRAEYEAVLFEDEGTPLGYALFRRDPDAIYLRQLFVEREHRRRGVGRTAVGLLLREVWPAGSRITRPVALTRLFLDNRRNKAQPDAEIRVEQIQGSVMMFSGKKDEIWPCALMASRAAERLRRNRHPYPVTHRSYEDAGHWMPCVYVPTAGERSGMKLSIGGTPEGAAQAQADCWQTILRSLNGIGSRKGSPEPAAF